MKMNRSIFSRATKIVVSKRLGGVDRRTFSDLPTRFKQAVSALQLPPSEAVPKKDVSNETKLTLYALYKQGEQGDCSGSRPGIFDPVGRAKYDAWKSLSGTSKDKAMEQYVAEVSKIFGGTLPNVSSVAPVSKKEHVESMVDSMYRPRSMADIVFPRKAALAPVAALQTVNTSVSANGVARLELNRPSRGNSFNMAMWEDVLQAWATVGGDARAKVVILSGAGSSFSTGMDLSVFVDFQSLLSKESCEGRKREAISHFIDYLQNAISGPENCPVPVIAAIHGQCIGGAIDLICAADLRYCTKDAVFCIKETDLAIVADIGTLQRMPKLIGTQKTAELTYTARNFSGAEAEAMGLVAKSFDTVQEMNTYVDKVASEIAQKSPLTIR